MFSSIKRQSSLEFEVREVNFVNQILNPSILGDS